MSTSTTRHHHNDQQRMALLTHQSPPVVAPNPKAVELSQVVLALPVDGKTEVYQGEALQWDVSKAPTIALVFTGPCTDGGQPTSSFGQPQRTPLCR